VHATQNFSHLAKTASKVLVQFETTYLCEIGFSTLLHIKTKATNCLEQRVTISNKEPLYSMTIGKNNNKKESLNVQLLVYFINSLYRFIHCNDIMLVSITI